MKSTTTYAIVTATLAALVIAQQASATPDDTSRKNIMTAFELAKVPVEVVYKFVLLPQYRGTPRGCYDTTTIVVDEAALTKYLTRGTKPAPAPKEPKTPKAVKATEPVVAAKAAKVTKAATPATKATPSKAKSKVKTTETPDTTAMKNDLPGVPYIDPEVA
jgi:hypothetical protein